jgi:hypothetical protein
MTVASPPENACIVGIAQVPPHGCMGAPCLPSFVGGVRSCAHKQHEGKIMGRRLQHRGGKRQGLRSCPRPSSGGLVAARLPW